MPNGKVTPAEINRNVLRILERLDAMDERIRKVEQESATSKAEREALKTSVRAWDIINSIGILIGGFIAYNSK